MDGQTVSVDKEICIGSATCVRLAPATFEIAQNGIAIVKEGGIDLQRVLLAEQNCPTGAITVRRGPDS